ncbi:hypothetical protein DA2_2211 [Desulfovibrio sp. A2]|nr:hypothetical protein DA2_2211 [Desulfovibrio sp. A2]
MRGDAGRNAAENRRGADRRTPTSRHGPCSAMDCRNFVRTGTRTRIQPYPICPRFPSP